MCAYQGVRNVCFLGKFGVLCFVETSILRFGLLSYYRRNVPSSAKRTVANILVFAKLTHSMPLVSFDTPWRHQKTKRFTDVFRVYRKRPVVKWNGLNGKKDMFIWSVQSKNYFFKVSKWSTRIRCENCSSLRKKALEQQWLRSSVFIVNCEHLLTL